MAEEKQDRKFIKKVLDKKNFTHKDAVFAVRCWFVVHTDWGGYVENDYTFHKFGDGSITLSKNDGDDFLSFHDKEILDVILELLS